MTIDDCSNLEDYVPIIEIVPNIGDYVLVMIVPIIVD